MNIQKKDILKKFPERRGSVLLILFIFLVSTYFLTPLPFTMNKKLQKLLALSIALLFTGFGYNARASHSMGSELTYACIGPGMYVATLKIYRDCTGAGAPSAATLNMRAPGCNTGRSQPMTKVGTNVIGAPYCAQVGNACISTGRTNYEQVTFTTTIVFTVAERNCPEWFLSWTECCRPESTNLLNPQSANIYAEAMLKLSYNNNSPEFDATNVPILFVNRSQPIQISAYAVELDGDSLVYSIQNPLSAQTAPVAYGTYASSIVFNSDTTKFATLPAGSFSNSFPIVSYSIDWSQPSPIIPVPKFQFDSKTGSMNFIPSKFEPNTPSVQGKNKYVMSIVVEEYRTVSGIAVKIGAIRRDMMINVVDAGLNENPKITSVGVNGQQISENTMINLRPGTPMNFQFSSVDGNNADMLQVSSDAAFVLSGATFTATTANQPAGTVTWTPTAAHVRSLPYYFHITVKDNACPAKGFQVHTFGVKVSASGGVTGTSASRPEASVFTAYPNPFSQEITFKMNLKNRAESIVIYNLLGQQVDRISLTQVAAGEQNIQWLNAGKFAAGTYVAKLINQDKTIETLKFTKLQ